MPEDKNPAQTNEQKFSFFLELEKLVYRIMTSLWLKLPVSVSRTNSLSIENGIFTIGTC